MLLAAAPTGVRSEAPDLALRRDGLARQGDSLRVVVENRGTVRSGVTSLLASDRPFLGGPPGTDSHYRPSFGTEAVWIDRARVDSTHTRITLAFGRGLDPIDAAGEIRFPPGSAPRIQEEFLGAGAKPVRVEDDRVFWDFAVPSVGASFAVVVAVMPGKDASGLLLARPQRNRLPPDIYTSEGVSSGNVEIPVDLSGVSTAVTARFSVPELEPGARDTLTIAFPPASLDEVSLWVDPDNDLPELREGNNLTHWAADGDRWSLAALHLHSCFSEGPGSFDWQAWHAARSGYDLTWWSEHDWRMSCRDHLETIGFEEDEDLKLKLVDRGVGSRAEITEEETDGGSRALLLATGPDGGRARAVVRSERKRFAYALASEIDLEVRVFARSLQEGDVCDISFELSQHPYHERRLVYRLRYEGTEAPAETADDPWTRVLPQPVPTGGWVTVRLPLSRDAAAAWPNGADDNLVGLRAELRAAAGAEIVLDELRFRHERCGEELIRVQESWTRDYPNLAHEVGGEISFTRPHLARYGGDYGLLMQDLERDAEQAGDIVEAERIVRAVHENGALASWCHPLGATFFSELGPEEFQELIDQGLAGVDAVEIGYRQRGAWALADYVDLWNRTNAAGVVVTALGVNDSHHNQWAPWENNFATWLEAPAGDTAALLRALRDGRAFFGDPVRFRGRVSLQVGGTGMGGVVGGEGPRTVRTRLTEIGENRTVRLVGDGGELIREWTGVSGSGVLGEQLPPGRASTVRVEIQDAAGRPLAFTNPVYLDPEGRLGRRGE
jgi:hypothetical protein